MSVEIVVAAGIITLLGVSVLAIAAVVMVKAVLAVADAGGTLPVNALLAIAEIIRAIGGKKDHNRGDENRADQQPQ
ncbi:hypothetical protein ACIRU8_27165 [Streptomyces sp. NPDC101175]|uniref:hypothetical protein n=1 Tax=Streptomyces sp. NPDC101175 TaxID=3366123 RepID=UPI00383650A8